MTTGARHRFKKHVPPVVREVLTEFLDRSFAEQQAREGYQRGRPALEYGRLRALADSLAWNLLPRDSKDALRQFAYRAAFYLTDAALAAIKKRNAPLGNLAARAGKAARRFGRGEPATASTRADLRAASVMETPIPFANLELSGLLLGTVVGFLLPWKARLEYLWSDHWKGDPRLTPTGVIQALVDLAEVVEVAGGYERALIDAVPPIPQPLRRRADETIYSSALSTAAEAIFVDPCDEAVTQFVGDVFKSDAASRETVRKRRARRSRG